MQVIVEEVKAGGKDKITALALFLLMG